MKLARFIQNVLRFTFLHANKTTDKKMYSILKYFLHTPKFNIVEFFVVNFICVRLIAVGNYYANDCLHLTSSWRHVQVRV
jgi:hypothetical protein